MSPIFMSKLKLYNYWNLNFERSGIKPELIEKYMVYINKLIDKNVPIIFDFEHLCLLLGRNKNYLASVVNSNTSHYSILVSWELLLIIILLLLYNLPSTYVSILYFPYSLLWSLILIFAI